MYSIKRVNHRLFRLHISKVEYSKEVRKVKYRVKKQLSERNITEIYRSRRRRFIDKCIQNLDYLNWFITIGNKDLVDSEYIRKIKSLFHKYDFGKYIISFERFENGRLHCHILSEKYYGNMVTADVKKRSGFVDNEKSLEEITKRFGYNTIKKVGGGFENKLSAIMYLSSYMSKEDIDIKKVYSKGLRKDFTFIGIPDEVVTLTNTDNMYQAVFSLTDKELKEYNLI